MSNRAKIGGLKEITISADMLEQIEKIQDTERTHHKTWTEEEDAILLNFWEVKNKEALAKLLGVTAGTARTRYRKLTEEK